MALSIEQARKILGDKGRELSDEEIEEILESLHQLCAELLDAQERGEL